MLEHSLAKVHEARGNTTAAREAYGRALEEDLAFYPAHFELANLAFQAGDTAAGLSEMELATQTSSNDPLVRLVYAYVLMATKRYGEAEAQLTKAIELEPYFANLYHVLGLVYEAQKKQGAAIAQYEACLQRASLAHPMREETARRLAALRGHANGSGE
jgi:tetratricopeptide (TPR) repeat protein